MTKPKLNLREKAKAKMIAKTLSTARRLFTTRDYHAVGIRELAKEMHHSTGAIFANFSSKEQLFTEAMGFPPPVDGPLTRAAPMLMDKLLALLTAACYAAPPKMFNGVLGYEARIPVEFVDEAIQAMTLATSPLDGEAWARHLSSIRRDEPHTLAAGEPAASVPSDAAGDQ